MSKHIVDTLPLQDRLQLRQALIILTNSNLIQITTAAPSIRPLTHQPSHCRNNRLVYPNSLHRMTSLVSNPRAETRLVNDRAHPRTLTRQQMDSISTMQRLAIVSLQIRNCNTSADFIFSILLRWTSLRHRLNSFIRSTAFASKLGR